MKRQLSFFILLILLLCFSVFFSACHWAEEGETRESITQKRELNLEDNDFEDPSLDNEIEGANPVPEPHNEEDFIGMWNAPSDLAAHLYGNVNLTIKDNHKWSGNITGESFSGNWRETGEGITIQDSEGIIKWSLFFAEDGTLMFKDLDDEDASMLVLKPGNKAP